MDRQSDAERRRTALLAFMKDSGLKPAAWARQAGVSPNGIYNFLNGRSDSLSQRVLESLAAAAGSPISRLLGETTPAGNIVTPPVAPGEPRRRRDDAPPAAMRDVIMIPDLDQMMPAGEWSPAATLSRGAWPMARGYFEGVLGIRDAARLAAVEIKGDSMAPTLRAGDRVLVDRGDRQPSPPGLFALWNGQGTTVKRIEAIPGPVPSRWRILSDNRAHGPEELAADDIQVIGRVVWLGRRV